MSPNSRRPLVCAALAANLVLAPGVQSLQTAMQDSAIDQRERADKLIARAFATLEETRDDIPRESWDPRAIVDLVGDRPEDLLDWVRRETRWVPYRGVLRTAHGTLMDRMGNSLDRALLLLALLQETSHGQVRLANTNLSEEQAELVLERAARGRATERPEASANEPIGSEPERASDFAQDDIDRANRALLKSLLDVQRTAEDAVMRSAAQSAALLSSLREEGRVPSREDQVSALRARALEDARDHWWVQVHDGNGWIDLDPTLGAAPATPTRLLPTEALAELNDEAHWIVIRVIIERWKDRALEEFAVLEHGLIPGGLLGEPIRLSHAPNRWPAIGDLLGSEDPLRSLEEAVLAQDEWTPVLQIGEGRLAKVSFGLDGSLHDRTLPGYAQAVLAGGEVAKAMEKGAGGLGARIGNLLSGGTGDVAPPEELGPLLTAEWIEYEIRVPGEPPETIRREIFDTIGPAARASHRSGLDVPAPDDTRHSRLERGMALLGGTEILALPCDLSEAFLQKRVVDHVLAQREPLARAIADGVADADRIAAAAELLPFPSQLYALALARANWGGSNDVYLDRPNILSFHRQIVLTEGAKPAVLEAFDIVANGVGIDPSTDENPFVLRLEQGVLDTSFESVLLENAGEEPGSTQGPSLAFARSLSSGSPWSLVEKGQTEAWIESALPEDARARIEADLVDGYLAIVPARPVPVGARDCVGWWRIDPETGETLGIGDRGWGQTNTEYIMTIVAVTIAVLGTFKCLIQEIPEARKAENYGVTGGQGLCILKGVLCAVILLFLGWAAATAAGAASAVGSIGLGAQMHATAQAQTLFRVLLAITALCAGIDLLT